MSQRGNAQMNSSRAQALARRKAMSSAGKTAVNGGNANQTRRSRAPRPEVQAVVPKAKAKSSDVWSKDEAASPARAAAPAPARSRSAKRPVVAASSGVRSASLARRKTLSTRGKSHSTSSDRIRTAEEAMARSSRTQKGVDVETVKTKAKAKDDCGCGCGGSGGCGDAKKASASSASASRANSVRKGKNRSKRRIDTKGQESRMASRARRRALSNRGKAALNDKGMSAAQTARAVNPELTGRELAQTLREQRSRRGGAGEKQVTRPTGKVRPNASAANGQGAATDQPWKVGVSETSQGQPLTGTMVGRSEDVTGDEPGTCRAVTGTDYMGADVFREFCQAEPPKSVSKVAVSPTTRGNTVTGNEVGRSSKVTGDEPGTCKAVTGTEYVGADQSQAFCGTLPSASPAKVSVVETGKGKAVTGSNVGRSGKVTGDETGSERSLTGTQYTSVDASHASAHNSDGKASVPSKVGRSSTLRGGGVTGTLVGRSEKTTGDEAGSCRNVTGDDYLGQEQFSRFCGTAPAPSDAKVGVSQTLRGESVTGTMTGRSGNVTGDEPGTCKSVTGTPYAGAEQFAGHCDASSTAQVQARANRREHWGGSVMTGIQPSVGGAMTGDSKGACEDITGTPYVGEDQMPGKCPTKPAAVAAADFPQTLADASGDVAIDDGNWTDFSVQSPARQADTAGQGATIGDKGNGVTGSQYEQGRITGPFGMAGGKVTGTEEMRFGSSAGVSGTGASAQAAVNAPAPNEAEADHRHAMSRISGEGVDPHRRITGDDWDRGEHVTGTEGLSATRRNPTRRGTPMSVMAPLRENERNDDVPVPPSKITGSSGNTETGSLVTYSGGARG